MASLAPPQPGARGGSPPPPATSLLSGPISTKFSQNLRKQGHQMIAFSEFLILVFEDRRDKITLKTENYEMLGLCFPAITDPNKERCFFHKVPRGTIVANFYLLFALLFPRSSSSAIAALLEFFPRVAPSPRLHPLGTIHRYYELCRYEIHFLYDLHKVWAISH